MSQGQAGTEYVPRKGSACDLALQYLRAHGRTGRDALAIAIDKEPNELRALLAFPIRLGAIRSGLGADGKCWYEEGQRIVTLPPPDQPKPSVQAVAKDVLRTLPDEVLAQCNEDVQAVVANVRAAADATVKALESAIEEKKPTKGDQPRFERGREGMEPEACESATGRGTDGAPALATLPHDATAPRDGSSGEEGILTGTGRVMTAPGRHADQLDMATLVRVRRERHPLPPEEKPEVIGRLRIALWSDGFLVIKRGGECIEFNRAEARQIVGYLDSICLDSLREAVAA
jgi:hypothetical protein